VLCIFFFFFFFIQILIENKDWDGFSAFELYDSTIADTRAQERTLTKENMREQHVIEDDLESYDNQVFTKSRKGGTDLYTWGHNTNYVLGHSDSENRTNPERVRLDLESQKSRFIMKRPTCLIESVVMSKYHMAILTSDASLNLLVCGFGRGGRLGLGKGLETQFTPVPVQWPERIASVALGRDHTIAVTETGNVISFGSNRYGQLGNIYCMICIAE
jgi:alpha-tubulin suppressor-like RCC1 family protein